MTSRSDHTGHCPVSSHLRPNTDPAVRSDVNRKRNSYESLQRSSKRSRTSQSPSDSFILGFSSGTTDNSASLQTLSLGSSASAAGSLTSSTLNPSIITGSGEGEERKSNKRLSEETDGPRKRSKKSSSSSKASCIQVDTGNATSDNLGTSSETSICLDNRGPNTDPSVRSDVNRKRNSYESLQRSSKRSRTSQSPSDSFILGFSSGTTDNSASLQTLSLGSSASAAGSLTSSTSNPPIITGSGEGEERKSNKRLSEETEGPRKRSKNSSSSSKTPCIQVDTGNATSDNPGTSSETSICLNNRADFKTKYREEKKLGEGGFATVFAGYRREDDLPVAIKHISQHDITRTSVLMGGRYHQVPLEVALMLQVHSSAPNTSATITLLDWFDLDDELILILERPVPCMDLENYIFCISSDMLESEGKIIVKQLVDAILEIHSRGVFHNDIKLENILIETISKVPRPRIIDFGCGTFLSDNLYRTEQGTYLYTSPEWFLERSYRAEPATVWQLGVVVYAMLHKCFPFSCKSDITDEEPDFSHRQLSLNCKDFILSCLEKSPKDRASLETLKTHPWLV